MFSESNKRPLIEVLKVTEQQSYEKETSFPLQNSFTCGICCENFLTTVELQQHNIKHIIVKPFQCYTCNESFFSEKNLKKHRFKHSGLKPYQCDICKKRYEKKLKYEIQCRTHGTEYLCSSCFDLFSLSSELGKDDNSVHHDCDVCNQQYMYKPVIVNEHGCPKLIDPYLCVICNEQFDTRRALDEHADSHVELRKKFSCNVCKEGFPKLPLLNKHEKTHLKSEPNCAEICYLCKLCEKTFTHLKDLEEHYNDDHFGENKYICPTCRRVFFWHHLLQLHMLSHIGHKKRFTRHKSKQVKS